MRPSPEAGSGNFVTFELRTQIKPDPTLQTVKLSFLYLLGGFKVLFQKIMTLNVICVGKYLQIKMSWQNMNQVKITVDMGVKIVELTAG